MRLTEQIATHFRQIHFGGNWTSVNLKETLADVNWQQATRQLHSFNNIATLVYHVNYYVSEVLKVLQGQPLNALDKFSFDHTPIESLEGYRGVCQPGWTAIGTKALGKFYRWKIRQLLQKYSRHLEHAHYHLGQIVLIKKLVPSIFTKEQLWINHAIV